MKQCVKYLRARPGDGGNLSGRFRYFAVVGTYGIVRTLLFGRKSGARCRREPHGRPR